MHAVLKPSRGHNLLEVILAATIFATVLIMMLGLWRIYHSALTQSKNRLIASSLARSVMEQHLAGGYGALTPILNTPQIQSFTSRGQVRGRSSGFQCSVEFLATQATPVFRRLVVKVAWTEDSGKKSLTYESCLFKTE